MKADGQELAVDQMPQDPAEPTEPNVLLDSTFDVIAHTLRSTRCSLMLLDSASAELRVGRARGLSSEVISRSRAKLGESIAGMVASSRQPLLIRDLNCHPELSMRAVGGCKTNSLLSVPVVVRGEVYGVLNVTDRVDGVPFDEHDLATLSLLASHLALCIENSLLQAQIQLLANTDGLTGVYNHRYFHERLHEEIERASRFDKSVSLLMIDVNGFKEFNDTYGHPAGDVILQEIASMIRKQVRRFDLVSRYGGDEFTVILPETDARRALEVAARIARSVAAHRFLRASAEGSRGITVSTGLSTYPVPGGSKQELIEQADKAMYKAKQGAHPHIYHWTERLTAENGMLHLVT